MVSSITFTNANNILFMPFNKTFTLNNGENATFIKVDDPFGSSYETYQLISIMKALP